MIALDPDARRRHLFLARELFASGIVLGLRGRKRCTGGGRFRGRQRDQRIARFHLVAGFDVNGGDAARDGQVDLRHGSVAKCELRRRANDGGVRFELDPSGPRVFDPEEMRTWLESKPGAPFTENSASKDVSRIRDRYGEKAYIQAEIQYEILTSVRTSELDLVFKIKENDKIYVGRLQFEGNTKTKEEVLRREYTRLGFANQLPSAAHFRNYGWTDGHVEGLTSLYGY